MANRQGPTSFGWLVRLTTTRELVGYVAVTDIVRGYFQSGYLGYHVFAGHERKGLMTEGVGLAIREAFGELGLHRLEANIQPENRASIGLARACGFVKEGYSAAYLEIEGRWRDHERWAIIATRPGRASGGVGRKLAKRAARISIAPLRTRDVADCVNVMRSLPDWFGIEAAILKYGEDLRSRDGFAAFDRERLVGFVGLKRYGAHAIEINVIAIHPRYRRRGIGTQLLAAVEARAAEPYTRFLHTKTVSPAREDWAYAESRAFWTARGFVELDEHGLWGVANPCLVLVKVLR